MPLRDHDPGRSLNYLNAEELIELLHVRHLELVGKEGLDFVDVILVRLTKPGLWIDGVLTPVNILRLGFGLMYTLLVANRAKVIVKHLGATSSLNYKY